MLHVYPENQSSPMFFDTFESSFNASPLQDNVVQYIILSWNILHVLM